MIAEDSFERCACVECKIFSYNAKHAFGMFSIFEVVVFE